MAKKLYEESNIRSIADAIRYVNGLSTSYLASQMAAAIRALKKVFGTKSISSNGTYSASSDNLDGFSQITVNVPNTYTAGDEGKVVSSGALVSQAARSSQITENGTYDTTVNNSVTVNISGESSATLITKSITQNGTYAASADSADGYSSVNVNVQGGGGFSPEDALSGTMTTAEHGITFSERSISGNVGTIKGTEASAGFEGMNIVLSNLTAGKLYVVSFDWQTISGDYFSGQWMYGFMISNTVINSYDVRYNVYGWTEMTRDLNKHSYALVFYPSGTTAYLVFSLPGYSDESSNVFELTNLKVIDPSKITA